MKRLIIVLMICFVFASTSVNADKLKLDLASISTGKSAVSSGLDLSFFFGNKENMVEITGNHERSYGSYLFKIDLDLVKIRVGPYGGIFKNIPHFGIYAGASIAKIFNFLHWRGWELCDAEREKMGEEIKQLFSLSGVSVSLGKFNIGYYYMNFRGIKSHLPGISIKIPINNFSVIAGVDYKISKKCENEPLFKLGLTYRPRK